MDKEILFGEEIEVNCKTYPDPKYGLVFEVHTRLPIFKKTVRLKMKMAWEFIKEFGFDFCMHMISEKLERFYREEIEK